MTPSLSSSEPIPLRFPEGGPADGAFAGLRGALSICGFTEAGICARLQLERISKFELEPAKRAIRPPVAEPDALELLIRLMLEGESMPVTQIVNASTLPLQVLINLGLAAPVRDRADLIAGTVTLVPTRGLYIVADRQGPVHESPTPIFTDIVYPAAVPNTDLFLELLRAGPCDTFLDLCAGTGIAALLAAKNGARHAYACDITNRSTVFAEFNRQLNGIPNVTAARGDLYEAAGELTFDRIVAHPPYVPVFRPQFIFDSGGQDGEQIVRRIVEGLPRYLRPGGVFQGLMMGTDREQPFEQRIREWLGPDEKEFDVALAVRKTVQPHDWAADSVIRNRGPVTDITEWRAFFRGIGAKAMPYGFVTIQRRKRIRPVFTVRRQTGERSGPVEHAWLVQWETQIVEQGTAPMLTARPRSAPGVQMTVEHHLEAGDWVPDAYLLQVDYPFRMEMRTQPWTAFLLLYADGILTGAELLEKLKTDGVLHSATPEIEFAEMLAVLVSGGFLRV